MFTISRATPNDTDSLTQIAIFAKRHWNYPEEWIQYWMTKGLVITPEYILANETWLAQIEDKSVAYYSLIKNDEGLWLDNLWVLPEYIGQGIGKHLFNHALERCKALGTSVLKIESDPNAQSFYEKMGAKKVGESKSHLFGQERILPVMEIAVGATLQTK
jgi:GNAT superfamily N-acetyltransferase